MVDDEVAWLERVADRNREGAHQFSHALTVIASHRNELDEGTLGRQLADFAAAVVCKVYPLSADADWVRGYGPVDLSLADAYPTEPGPPEP